MPRAGTTNNSRECCAMMIQIHQQWKNRHKPGQQKVLLLHHSDSSQDQHRHHLNLQVEHTHPHCQEPGVCHLVSSWSLYVQAACAAERRHNYCQKPLNLSSFSLKLFPHVLSLSAPVKSPSPSFLQPCLSTGSLEGWNGFTPWFELTLKTILERCITLPYFDSNSFSRPLSWTLLLKSLRCASAEPQDLPSPIFFSVQPHASACQKADVLKQWCIEATLLTLRYQKVSAALLEIRKLSLKWLEGK